MPGYHAPPGVVPYGPEWAGQQSQWNSYYQAHSGSPGNNLHAMTRSASAPVHEQAPTRELSRSRPEDSTPTLAETVAQLVESNRVLEQRIEEIETQLVEALAERPGGRALADAEDSQPKKKARHSKVWKVPERYKPAVKVHMLIICIYTARFAHHHHVDQASIHKMMRALVGVSHGKDSNEKLPHPLDEDAAPRKNKDDVELHNPDWNDPGMDTSCNEAYKLVVSNQVRDTEKVSNLLFVGLISFR